jgi:two-component system, cell cycle response regulator
MTSRTAILNAKILLVDDDEDAVQLLQELLRHEGYTSVSLTTDPRKVSDLHAQQRFDLIVLDIQMPGMNGFEVMQALKAGETDYVPVLAVTGEPGHKLAALRAGAKDFVSKPFDWDEVFVRVYNMLEVKLLLEEARGYAKELASMALQDPLTGLANRRLLPERVWMAIAHARRNRSHMAVLYLDLDGFKEVNDTLGHAAGDQLLKMVAERLVGAVREEDTVARIGGDEFMIALWQVADVSDAATVASKLIDLVAEPYEIDGHTVTVTTSAGASIYPTHGQDVDALMKSADIALYKAKQAGKNQYRLAETARESATDGDVHSRGRTSHWELQ